MDIGLANWSLVVHNRTWPNQLPLRMPVSGTPAADAPVAPPLGIAGRKRSMKARLTYVLLLLLSIRVVEGGEPSKTLPPAAGELARSKKVGCRGVIEKFEKEGFQILTDGGCEWSDVTWVVIEEPSEYAGVRHMVLSKGTTDRSPLGTVGERISFSANVGWLDLEKHPERWIIDPKKLFPELNQGTAKEKKGIEQGTTGNAGKASLPAAAPGARRP